MTTRRRTTTAHTPRLRRSRTGRVPSHQKPKRRPDSGERRILQLSAKDTVLCSPGHATQPVLAACPISKEGERAREGSKNPLLQISELRLRPGRNIPGIWFFPVKAGARCKWQEGSEEDNGAPGKRGMFQQSHAWPQPGASLPAEEERVEQEEGGQFLFHILPGNSNFAGAFRPAGAQPEILLPIPRAGSREHPGMRLAQEPARYCQPAGRLTPATLRQEQKQEQKKAEKRTGETG